MATVWVVGMEMTACSMILPSSRLQTNLLVSTNNVVFFRKHWDVGYLVLTLTMNFLSWPHISLSGRVMSSVIMIPDLSRQLALLSTASLSYVWEKQRRTGGQPPSSTRVTPSLVTSSRVSSRPTPSRVLTRSDTSLTRPSRLSPS